MKKPAQPKLGSLEPAKSQYNPGDRVVVRVSRALTSDERRSCEASVNQWCRVDVNQLFVDCSSIEIVARRQQSDDTLVAGLDHYQFTPDTTTIRMSCSAVRVDEGDTFELYLKHPQGPANQILIDLRRWVGPDHEIVVMPWRFPL